MKVHWLLRQFLGITYMAPADAGGGGGGDGGAVDRGDDFEPTGDDAKKPDPKEPTDEDKERVGLKDKKDKKGDEEEEDPEKKDEDDEKDDEEDKDKPKGKKDSRIPLKRHQEILNKERERREALERELAKTKGAEQVAATNEAITAAEDKLTKAEGEYNKLLVDGEVEKATAKMREIRALERQISETKSLLQIQAAEARAYERVRYDTTVERLEQAYPQINPDHEDYDEDLAGEMIELRDGYVATGKYTRAEAVQKAAKVLLGAATTRQKTATEAEVRVDKEDLAKATAEERRKAQLKKNAEVAGKQPPNINKAGQDHDKNGGGKLTAETVMKMSQDEFAKLNEADLAKLRGDDV
jgi:hypothetical protein